MSDKFKDYIEQFHEQSVFIPTKTLRLTGAVDIDMYDLALANLHALDSVTGPITIKLNSEGGCLTSAKAIYDLIRGCKNYVRIQCYGEVASAATIILQAADHRIASPNSKLMIHMGVESVPEDHPRNVDSLYNEHKKDMKWIEDCYLKRIKEKKKRFTRANLQDIIIFDRYLDPKEALSLGLIDEVGELQ